MTATRCVGLFVVVTLSCVATPDVERTTSTASGLQGPGVTVVTSSTALPEAATGLILVPQTTQTPSSGFCNAIVISRAGRNGNGVVLTAGHCACDSGTNAFINPTTPFPFQRPPGATTVGTAAFTNVSVFGGQDNACDPGVFGPSDLEVRDLGVINLAAPLPLAAFPRLPRVYTGADFPNRWRNVVPAGFIGLTTLRTGGGSASASSAPTFPVILQQADITSLRKELSRACEPGGCFPFSIRIDRDQQGAVGQQGDSGGPLTFLGPEPGGATIFGIASTQTEPFLGFGGDFDGFSPTWDNGDGNGVFIRSFLADADEDGVDDAVDNCPPSLCASANGDPFLCANADQVDADLDGIGDACDNCPPSICAFRGQPITACANNDQFDFDHDKTGDVCDSSVTKPNGNGRLGDAAQFADNDGDGVGDASDNCPNRPNRVRACTPASADADCGGGAGCYQFPSLGFCQFEFTSCWLNAHCASGTCVFPGASGRSGRCAFQRDDSDLDGLGDVCDLCPDPIPNRPALHNLITANSNVDGERRKSVSAQGDQCEPVPHLVSKGIVGLIDQTGGTPNLPVASTAEYTTFMGSAGFGTGGNRTTIPNERAGYRYCDCIDAGLTRRERADCLMTTCQVTDATYETDSSFAAITTVTQLGNINQLPLRANATLGEEFLRTFTQDVQCNDFFEHRSFAEVDPGMGQCRLGQQQQLTLWDHSRDSLRRIGAKSAGVVLSHVLRTNGITGGSATGGPVRDDILGLRDTIEYVETPLVDILPPTPPHPNFESACTFAGCMMMHRPDWKWLPVDFYQDAPSPIEYTRHYGRFAALLPTDVITILGTPSHREHIVTYAISPALQALIRGGAVSFLSPVEDGTRGGRFAERAPLLAVIVAQPWRQAFDSPLGVLSVSGALEIRLPDETASARSARVARASLVTADASPFGAPRFVPSDREGSRAVFSGTEQSVYMVGGRRDASMTSITGEVWRYDFDSNRWNDLFLDVAPSTLPGEVKAISYDEETQRIVMIDDGVATKKGKRDKKNKKHDLLHKGNVQSGLFGQSRLVVIDTRSRTIKEISKVARTDHFARVSLVHKGGDEYVLARGSKHGRWFTVRTFRLGANGDAVQCVSKDKINGELLDDPIRTPQGIVAPVKRRSDGAHDMVTLTTSSRCKHMDDEDEDE